MALRALAVSRDLDVAALAVVTLHLSDGRRAGDQRVRDRAQWRIHVSRLGSKSRLGTWRGFNSSVGVPLAQSRFSAVRSS